MSSVIETLVSTRLLSRLRNSNIHVEGLSVIPATHDELKQTIAIAAEEGSKVTTSTTIARRLGCLHLRLNRLNRLLRLRPEEQIITVEAGMTLRELQEHLRQHHLLSPFVDSPNRTVADIFAYNLPNMQVRHHPSLGHWLLGFEALMGDGRIVKYGGDVVKNVTGHNLGYLLTGSQNQYGLLTNVTIKAMPLPTYSKLTQWHFDRPEDCFAFLRQSRLVEVPCSDITSVYRTRNVFGMKLLAHFSGVESDVSRCLDYAKEHYRNIKAVTIPVDTLDSDALWSTCEKWDWFGDAHRSEQSQYLLAQVALPQTAMHHIEETSQVLRQSLDEAEWLWHGQSQRLLMRWHMRGPYPEASYLKLLRSDIETLGGRVDIIAVPENSTGNTIFQTQPKVAEKAWLNQLQTVYNPYNVLAEPSL